jgi:predicted lipoprotein with Yx(FWY)xxD motif
VYRSFPSGQRLYTFDRDPPGHSVCNVGCAMAWPPVLAPSDAAATGVWTIVRRADGSRQWAFRGKPVYTRFHDAPGAPTGEAANSAWHLIPYNLAGTGPVAIRANR